MSSNYGCRRHQHRSNRRMKEMSMFEARAVRSQRLDSITPAPSNTRSHHISAPPPRRSSRVLAAELADYRSRERLRVDRECRRRCDPFAFSWSSAHVCGFNCPSMPPVFQVEEASRRTSPVSKSRGCVFSAIVSSISQPGVVLFKESISVSPTYSV
jgi:hypothetical protein